MSKKIEGIGAYVAVTIGTIAIAGAFFGGNHLRGDPREDRHHAFRYRRLRMHGMAIIQRPNQLQANRGHEMSYESAIVIVIVAYVFLMFITWLGGR